MFLRQFYLGKILPVVMRLMNLFSCNLMISEKRGYPL
jgi:hypothetical protein